ncbi:MAG: excinuclease ABC subunit UvrA [Anaerolineae bacterium]
MSDAIVVRGARLHNLQNVTLSIPKNRLVVFTGVSGSGKSTLAIDTLHAEGQRLYMESLGMVSYVSKPPVDAIEGLSPSIAVGQGLTNRSPRSTVGTATDVYTYLRILYARAGHRPCPRCGGEIAPLQGDEYIAGDRGPEAVDEQVVAGLTEDEDEPPVTCPHCGALLPGMGMAMFSFNKPAGACPTCTGLGTVYAPDLARMLDEDLSVEGGAIREWAPFNIIYNSGVLRAAGRHYGFEFDTALPVRDLGSAQRDLLIYGVESAAFRRHYPHTAPPAGTSRGRFEGIVTNLLRRHAEHAGNAASLERIERALVPRTCPDCGGARLRPEWRAVTVAGRRLVAGAEDPERDEVASRLSLFALAEWLANLQGVLRAEEWQIAEPVVAEARERVRRLVEVGLGYLTLEQGTPSLSAGEGQRLRLAALLGSGLTGVLYVLDEPTIGLHPRDTARLIGMLHALRNLGNTVLVIEHDLEMIAAADHVIDFGPGAGRDGGRVVAQGTPAEVAGIPASATGRFLSGAEAIPVPGSRRRPDGPGLTILGAREHNLRDITVRLPLRDPDTGHGLLVAVTGVSGSGKSTLLFDILDRAARQRYHGANLAPGAHEGITGWEHLERIITVDQAPLAGGSRSNAATYTEAYTPIRQAFAALPAARAAGLTPATFSFNVPGGRCERCQGAGVLSVEMHFLPDVLVRCPVCHGRRFKPEVLAVRFGQEAGGGADGCDIAEVLDLTIAEALPLFGGVPAVHSRLALMAEVGLGYLPLGQPASTFSGGEAQRVKLARELSRRAAGHTLYLLDEPTTGLHPADVTHLLHLLGRLTGAGHTVVVIEHNLDVIASADWVIDLGPEGGAAGGRVVAEGTPGQVAGTEGSHTGAALRRVLRAT